MVVYLEPRRQEGPQIHVMYMCMCETLSLLSPPSPTSVFFPSSLLPSLPLSLPLGQLPEMTSGERVALIQERIRDVEKRWIELKNEVAYLDRKRRRARRKEREGRTLSHFTLHKPAEVN